MFVLLTPVRNEKEQIENLVKCIVNSTFKPDFWIIIDDHSTDGSVDEIKSLSNYNPFIHLVESLDNPSEYMGMNYSQVLINGWTYCLSKLKSENISYIGILDADIEFDSEYWEQLKNKLDSEKEMGIVSGSLTNNNSGKIVLEKNQRHHLPRGGMRLIKSDCFYDIGSIIKSRSPDAVMNAIARAKGWKTLLIPELHCLSIRPTDSKGEISGGFSRGQRAWNLQNPIIQVLIRGFGYMFKIGFRFGFNYVRGYFFELVKMGEKVENEFLIYYYHRMRYREWWNHYINKLTGVTSPYRFIC
ncbi:MAG: glycosyltransferase family 2 protein [Candidatus Marinimicrobia bacterium]|jgi:glycosyltransferase involved in cell wall biosynthesis|nr:glycosyltransferase family 2 protein [SAR202 cluster bacterium]MDP7609113.1 glycosyltransferase family 2 protein [Candidatus Neomarinimicrobiota bacterium]HJM46503.1 glycosyltransferase family 2 protein [Candidatus Neomarinimicrobiota bacterium]|tara:strand:- start:4802 stop:5701 length:900 start_codon:yes stop_codon:yes gene_type:complete